MNIAFKSTLALLLSLLLCVSCKAELAYPLDVYMTDGESQVDGSSSFGTTPESPRDYFWVLGVGPRARDHSDWKWETPAEAVTRFGGQIILHCPGGRTPDPEFAMELDQLSQAVGRAHRFGATEQAKRSADMKSLIEAGRMAKKLHGWKYYGGGEKTLRAFRGESAYQWHLRAWVHLLPVILAEPDVMYFDSTPGGPWNPDDEHASVVYGPDGGMRMLIDKIRRETRIIVGVEPEIRMDAHWLHDVAVNLKDERYHSLASRNWIVRGVQLRDPKHQPFCGMQLTGAYNLPNDAKWAYIVEAQKLIPLLEKETGCRVTIGMNLLQLPKEGP